jgi:hypothetical protein
MIVAFVASRLTSCGFRPAPSLGFSCSDFDKLPITPLTAQSSQIVFEQVGTVIAIHGSGSAKVDPGDGNIVIRVEQSQHIPLYVNQAAVFLNGWRSNYPSGDHYVRFLGTFLSKINLGFDPNTKTNILTWDAVGSLTDDSFKQGMAWTYTFTIVAWNSVNLNAVVDQGGGPGGQYCPPDGTFVDNYFFAQNKNTNTALSCFFSFIQNPAFANAKTVAVLPRGTAYGWNSGDHRIRQVAYNLDHSDIFADHTKRYNKQGDDQAVAPLPDTASHADSGFVSWDPYSIFKDNDKRRDYFFSEIASAMAGADVGVLQPPYAVLPADDPGFFSGCDSSTSSGAFSQDLVIEDIPFQFAIPMLTGWDLEYQCEDHNVKEIGIWIDHWSYQSPGPGAAGGTLRYTVNSILRDNGNNGFASNHKITILGLKPTSGGKAGAGPAPAPAGTKTSKKKSS